MTKQIEFVDSAADVHANLERAREVIRRSDAEYHQRVEDGMDAFLKKAGVFVTPGERNVMLEVWRMAYECGRKREFDLPDLI